MSSNPTVSILINNYNYGQFLAAAIDSAINQTYDNVEIIVVDDGSTDNSQAVIADYGSKIIPVLKKNGGQASAFNMGFARSRGEIICFLDADDVFVPHKIAEVVRVFTAYPEAGWCFHPLEFVDRHLQSLNIEQQYTGESGVYDITDDLKKGKLRGKLPFHSVATSGLCYRRSLLAKILPMPESIKITSDDYLKYSAFALAPGYALLKKLAWQTIHDNNAYTFRKDKQELRAKIDITTAYLLREKIPAIKKFTNNIFAIGLGIQQQLPKQEREVMLLIEKYYSSLQPLEKLEVNLRAFYYRYKK